MTIITERRWKCDHCGNVSPPVEQNSVGYAPPMGWVVRLQHRAYPANGTVYHFCTEAHYEMWQLKREAMRSKAMRRGVTS